MSNEIYDKNGNAASEMTANTAIKKLERISPLEKLTAKIKGPDVFEEQWLYEEIGAIENEFLRKRAEHKCQELAIQLGGKKVEKMFTEYLAAYYKQRKKEEQDRLRMVMASAEKVSGIIDGQTNYTNLPEGISNLYCGTCWQATDKGVYYRDDKGMRKACSQPILIAAIKKSLNTGEEKVVLLFRHSGKWRRLEVDKDILASSQKIPSLHKYGISVTSNNAKLLIAFLQDMEDYSRDRQAIPIIYTTSKLGWNHDRTIFCPYTDSRIEFEGQGILAGLGRALKEKGNREAWYEKFKTVRGIPMIDFLAAANLSAMILGQLRLEGFCANLYGPSRGGKSVSSKICCSIFAGFQNTDRFIYSVDNTNNSVEGVLNVYSSLPLIMEDANNMTERQQRELQTLIMKLCNGIGRGRMRKDLSLREPGTWNTSGIITSENRITKDFHNTGSVNRVLLMRGTNEADCPFNKNGLSVADLLNFFGNNHGFCGRDFVKVLIEIGVEKLNEMLQEIQVEVAEKANEMKKSGGQIVPVAVMLLADRLAEKYLFKDGKHIKLEDAVNWMVDVDSADQNQRFYDSLMDSVIQNSGKFEGLGMTECMNNSQYWGRYFKDENKVAVLPSVLKKLANEENLDLKLFLEFLDDKGLIEADSRGNLSRNVNSRLLHKGSRMYVIFMPDRDEEEESEQEPEQKEFVDVSDEEIPFD